MLKWSDVGTWDCASRRSETGRGRRCEGWRSTNGGGENTCIIFYCQFRVCHKVAPNEQGLPNWGQ